MNDEGEFLRLFYCCLVRFFVSHCGIRDCMTSMTKVLPANWCFPKPNHERYDAWRKPNGKRWWMMSKKVDGRTRVKSAAVLIEESLRNNFDIMARFH